MDRPDGSWDGRRLMNKLDGKELTLAWKDERDDRMNEWMGLMHQRGWAP
jgi:hypothetical protein